jgi:N-acetylmuramoyl-L-alanine amidase
MSASPHNASFPELTGKSTNLGPSPVPEIKSPAITFAPGHEALQALLAFSSLHEQIRQRRARERRTGARLGSDDVWELEQFVLDEVLQLIAERALTITGADGVAIALAEGNAIICRASAGTIAPDAGARVDPNSGFSGACLRSGQIVRCDEAANDPRVNLQASRRLGARSMVAVPLAAQQSVIGLLEAFSGEAYGFNDSDVRSLNLLAELILAAMKPEEEDRLAQISQRVVAGEPLEGKPPRITEPHPQVPRVSLEPTSSALGASPGIFSGDKSENESKRDSRPGMAVVLLLVLMAVTLGGGLWWKIHQNTSPAMGPTAPVPPRATADQSASPTQQESQLAPPTPKSRVELPLVTGVQHWSAAESSTVVIDLQDQVQYEAHHLSDPERIFFDLHGTALAPGLFGKTIEVEDALLARVRIAQPTPGVTRVVLETKRPSDFSVSLEPNPYRLVVKVHSPGAKTDPSTKIDLLGPITPAHQGPLASSPQSRGTDEGRIRARAPNFRIVLDAGHGGWDLGTVGRKGLLEKDLVLDIVARLGHLIEGRLGANVIYTREDDTYIALEKRAEIANLSQANLFISIHANYSDDSSARGVETFYTNTYSSLRARTREADAAENPPQNLTWTNVDIREKVRESQRIAASVQRELYGMIAAKTPGIPNRGVKEASYVVLTGTSMPAILTEVSFVSSPTDEDNLESATYRQQIAEALYKGIARYVAASRRVDIASTSAKPAGR